MMQWSEEQIERGMEQLNGWNRKNHKRIVKSYLFSSFMKAMTFVNEAARLAEQADHHPHISIDYRKVTLELTTWSAGGLTELDFKLAQQFDQLYENEKKST